MFIGKRFKIVVLSLAISFVCQFTICDMSWSTPSGYHNNSTNDHNLGIAPFSQDPTNQDRATARYVVNLVEGNGGATDRMLNDVANALRMPDIAALLESQHVEVVSDRDADGVLRAVMIKMRGYQVRYYDRALQYAGRSVSSHATSTWSLVSSVSVNPWLSKDVFRTSVPSSNVRQSSVLSEQPYVKPLYLSDILTDEPPALPYINKRGIDLIGKNPEDNIEISIETLKAENIKDLEGAVRAHNEAWGDNFTITIDDARSMLSCNPGGHLLARDLKTGDVIAVAWSVSLHADSIEDVPGSLHRLMKTTRKKGDNVWLHYAVGTMKEYQARGFGPKVSSELLKSTEPLSEGMTRGTYSPMNGYGSHKDSLSSTAYLLTRLRAAKPGQETDYLYYRPEEEMDTFSEFLQKRGIGRDNFSWFDYRRYVAAGGISIEDYVMNTGRGLECTAANMHVKNGARIARIIDGGREGDLSTGECAFISIYRDMINDATDEFIGKIDLSSRGAIDATFMEKGSVILLSASLFDDSDREQLERRLKHSNIDNILIMDPKQIMVKARNNKTGRDSLGIVLAEDDINNPNICSQGDKSSNIRSSVLVLKDKMTAENFLYLEGVVGLTAAIMRQDEESIRILYKSLTGTAIDKDILLCLRDDAVKFAIKAALKFKPIVVEDVDKLDSYKHLAVSFLVAA